MRLGIRRAWMHWLENDARLARVADELGYFRPLRFSRDKVCDGFLLDLHDKLHGVSQGGGPRRISVVGRETN